MKRLIEWSIAHHRLVLALSVLLAAAGAWTARDMPVDVFPDLTAPTVTILTEGRGMAPDELETLVTFPIEAAMNGASGVRRVRSATAVGIAVVWVEFDWGTDIFQARQVVAEKLALASGSLPPQVERPILAPVSSIMGEILFFAVSSDVDDPLTLRTLADTIVRRRLLAVAGVSQVTPIGGAERQFQVIAHPDQLRANNISVTELLDGVRGASQNTSAGIFMDGPQEYVLQTIGRARTPQEIGDSVIALRGDRPVLVRDIADVREGAALKRGEGSRSGKPAVIIGVQKQPGANTVELTARLDDELDALQRELPRGMTIDRRIFRQADFIEVAVSNVVRALRDGGLLVIAIVFLFLANFRAAAITLTAIPLSLAAAVLAMRGFGVTINTMTLGGLAIAIGALVDDAIIDVENVVRRLRENAARPRCRTAADRHGGPRRDAGNPHLHRLRDGDHRPGLPADLRSVGCRRPSPLTAGVCLHRRAAGVTRRGHRRHTGALLRVSARRAIDPHRTRRLGGAHDQGTLRAGSAARARSSRARHGDCGRTARRRRGGDDADGHGVPAGVSRRVADDSGEYAAGNVAGEVRRDRTAVSNRSCWRSRRWSPPHGGQGAPSTTSTCRASRRRRSTSACARRGVRGPSSSPSFGAASRHCPGTNVTIGQPISHRIDHMLSGTRANIAVKVFGDDLPTLRRLGERVREVVAAVPGAVDVSLEQQTDVPFIRFVLNRPAIARYGLRADDVADAVETSLAGTTVGRIFDRAAAFDLVVKFDPSSQTDFDRLGDLPIDTPNGGPVPIRLLADVRREEGPNMILRENVQRRIVISSNVAGRDLGTVVQDMRAAVNDAVSMPAGYRVEFGGQFESAQGATERLLFSGIALVVALFTLLVLAFGRPRDALLIMLNLPLALIGGVAGVFLAGGVLSVASMIGFITLFGIATRNGIMLVSHIRHLIDVEGVADFREAVERGARERVVPILMTAMAAGLALIPLALGGGRSGSEIQTPMAIVILCGLTSSTLLNMVVVPSLYLRYGRVE